MAFNNLGEYGIDKSDLSKWATSQEAKAFLSEIKSLKGKAFRGLLKGGAQNHDRNAESYNAYESVIQLFNEISE